MTALLEAELLSPALVLPVGAEFGGPLVRPVRAVGAAPRAAVVLATLRASSASAASLGAPVVLVGAEALGVGVAVTRAHSPSTAVSLQQRAAGDWEEVGQNLPRWSRLTRRLLVEPGDANALPNPRFGAAVAGVVGAGGSLGTGVSVFGTMTVTVVDTGVEDGVPYIEARFQGSATAGVDFAASGTIAANNTQVWVSTFFCRLVSGSLTNVTVQNGLAVGGGTITSAQSNIVPSAASLASQRFTHSSGSTGATSSVRSRLRLAGTGSFDLTLRLGAPQLELTAASTPMLPVAGTPAAASRAIDVPIWTPATMPARGALVLRGSVPALAGASPLGLVQFDDGTDSNRIAARIAAGGGQPECLVVAGGVTLATITPVGALVAGAEWRAILAWSPGAIRFGTTAGGVATALVARPPGLSRALFLHANAAGTLPGSGEFDADLRDYWPSEAEALALLTV